MILYKCDGCGKTIRGKEYKTWDYEFVEDEEGRVLMVEDHGPCRTFGKCCVQREVNTNGFRGFVVKNGRW